MRFWRWSKRVVVAVIGSLLCYALWLVIEREWSRDRGEHTLAETVARIEALDPGWRWESLDAARKFPPDDQNSARLIPKIKALSAKEWGKWATGDSTRLLDIASNVRYPAWVLKSVRDDLAASPEAIKVSRTLMGLPQGNRKIVLAENPLSTLLEDTQNTRHVVDVLRWDTVVSLEDGKNALVAADLVAGLNASRSIGDEPFMISQLIRIATRSVTVRSIERAIAQSVQTKEIEALQLAALQDALAVDAEEPLLLNGIRGERAMFDILLAKIGDGSLDMLESTAGRASKGKPDFKLGEWLYRGRVPADRAFALQWLTDGVEAARLPLHEQPAAFAAIPEPPNDKEHILSRLLLPTVDKVASAHWRNVGEARCAIAGIACERFRLKHGRWPATLVELCPQFLREVPLDPYNGQSLRLANQTDGIVVHTVSPTKLPKRSETNDIAEQILNKRKATRPGLPHGIDIGFRLWNPESRRLPPPPDPPKHGDDQ